MKILFKSITITQNPAKFVYQSKGKGSAEKIGIDVSSDVIVKELLENRTPKDAMEVAMAVLEKIARALKTEKNKEILIEMTPVFDEFFARVDDEKKSEIQKNWDEFINNFEYDLYQVLMYLLTIIVSKFNRETAAFDLYPESLAFWSTRRGCSSLIKIRPE